MARENTEKKVSRSRELAAKVIFAALQILKDRGGQAAGREVIAEVENRVQLDEWATARHPLWQEFYDKLTDQDKTALPLVPIYFYAASV